MNRLRYIDRARGLAVLVMIEAHTIDAWTRPAERASTAFRNLTILGGFAAPLFLWLAGLAAVLAASRAAARSGRRRAAVDAGCRRGLEIFVLAFLFRLQAFVLSPGGAAITLFRVDILNVMGPALALTALVWGAAASSAARTALFSAVACAIALATPIARESSLVGRLPIWVQWYLRPAGEYTTFTMLPWAGFVFAGGAVGALLAAARGQAEQRRLHAWIAAAGAFLVALGFATAARPALFAGATFWTSSPTFFAIRAGILMLLLAGLFVLDARPRAAAAGDAAPAPGWLARFGQRSLFVYWIHVELVYGYATWPLHHRLPVPVLAAAYAAFCLLMYRAIVLRDTLTAAWRARGRAREALQTA